MSHFSLGENYNMHVQKEIHIESVSTQRQSEYYIVNSFLCVASRLHHMSGQHSHLFS